MFCFTCKADYPKVSMKKTGTMVTVQQHCKNCPISFSWRSQPLMMGTYPAGNMLLSFAILMAGASISKILPTGECKTKIEYIISAICSSRCNFLTCFLLLLALEQTALIRAEKRKLTADPQPTKRRARQCTKCKAPMRGHPRSHCPQNLPQP